MIVHTRLYQIAQEVANRNGMTLEELREKHRNPSFVAVRIEAVLALRGAGASYSECGKVLDRDHSSIVHMVKKASARRAELTSSVRATG